MRSRPGTAVAPGPGLARPRECVQRLKLQKPGPVPAVRACQFLEVFHRRLNLETSSRGGPGGSAVVSVPLQLLLPLDPAPQHMNPPGRKALGPRDQGERAPPGGRQVSNPYVLAPVGTRVTLGSHLCGSQPVLTATARLLGSSPRPPSVPAHLPTFCFLPLPPSTPGFLGIFLVLLGA